MDADPLFRGIIKHVYTPYATSTPYKVIGGTDKTRQKYMDYYARIRLAEKWKSIAYQYFKYANVFIYWFDGNLITLPPHKCRVSAVSLNGDPVVEFNIDSIDSSVGGTTSGESKKKFIDDAKLETLLKGYPKEVQEGVKAGNEWVQLNPENTFVMQGFKEDWQRYSVPMIASALMPLAKKSLIASYEDATINLGIRGMVHVKYGEGKRDDGWLPSRPELNSVQRLFQKAMSGYPLVVTNHMCSAEFVQADMQDLFQFDKYKAVNQDILASGGVSGIIVSGVSEDGSTFASAQVSMKTVSTRIQQAMDAFCEVMNKINMRVNGDMKGVSKTRANNVPTFIFMPLEMDGRKELEKSCLSLWEKGVLSSKTMLQTVGYDMEDELAQRKKEDTQGVTQTLLPRGEIAPQTSDPSPTDGAPPDQETRGRKELPDDERTSDPEDALRGKIPKPSSPEGSL